jgi:hypothetical protein
MLYEDYRMKSGLASPLFSCVKDALPVYAYGGGASGRRSGRMYVKTGRL